MLSPAGRFADKHNIENPELRAGFAYRPPAVGRPGIKLGIKALNRREDCGNIGWRLDDILIAYLGLTEQAREYLVRRARKWHEVSRLLGFWGPNHD